MVAVINACRASNLSNLKVKDLYNAKDDENFPNGKVIDQRKYKTSFVYGLKALIIPADIYQQLRTYVKHYRPVLVQDKELCGGKEIDDYYKYKSCYTA